MSPLHLQLSLHRGLPGYVPRRACDTALSYWGASWPRLPARVDVRRTGPSFDILADRRRPRRFQRPAPVADQGIHPDGLGWQNGVLGAAIPPASGRDTHALPVGGGVTGAPPGLLHKGFQQYRGNPYRACQSVRMRRAASPKTWLAKCGTSTPGKIKNRLLLTMQARNCARVVASQPIQVSRASSFWAAAANNKLPSRTGSARTPSGIRSNTVGARQRPADIPRDDTWPSSPPIRADRPWPPARG